MVKHKVSIFVLSVLAGFLAVLALGGFFSAPHLAAEAGVAHPEEGDFIVLAWNDLGMHCMNRDFADLAILPPFNTLWAQVIQRGNPPKIVTEGIQVDYEFPNNTYSVDRANHKQKTNFWDYEDRLFGVNLPDNVGLAGKSLAGKMDPKEDHFEAVGIPLTQYTDQDLKNPDPFQVALVTVKDAKTGTILAQTQTVAPVSDEMRCDKCHCDGPECEASYENGIHTGKVETNILTLHDEDHHSEYPTGYGLLMDVENRPVLCAGCHASNALGAPGKANIPNLSEAMHEAHAEEVSTAMECYNCHPGPVTKCLRDVMSREAGMTCIDCHGDMERVSQNANPWLNEPRCDNAACHGSAATQTQALYRFSQGHGGVYCEGCHDSTHAIAPSREERDGMKFVALQGDPGPLMRCTVCHETQEKTQNEHFGLNTNIIYLPLTRR